MALLAALSTNAQDNKSNTPTQTRCKAITKQGKGEQCKRMTTNKDGYCTQHSEMFKAGTLKGQTTK